MVNPISLLKPFFSRTNSRKTVPDSSNPLDQTSKKEIRNKLGNRSLYLRILDHRGKIILLPFLGLFIPVENIRTKLDSQTDNAIIKKTEEAQVGREVNVIDNQNNDYLNRVKFSALASISLLLLIAGSDRLLRSRQRSATHEIGHLLAFCATQSEIRSTSISLGDAFEDPHFYNDWENLSPKGLAQYLIMAKGADSLEKLKYRLIDITPSWFDKFAIGYMTTQVGRHVLVNQPKSFGQFLKFISKLEKIATELIQQIDPEVVDQLIERLMKDGGWKEDKIREIIREYKLDQLPPFEEKSKEVEQFLTTFQ